MNKTIVVRGIEDSLIEMRFHGTTLLAFLSAFVMVVRAEILPTMSLRYMAIEAEVIVIGHPVAAEAGILPMRYRVDEVLKGPAPLASQEIMVKNEGSFDPTLTPRPWADKNAVPVIRVEKALLFLTLPTQDGEDKGFGTVPSGIRALSDDGRMLVPSQFKNPGPQYLVPASDQKWETMLARVTDDLPKIASIRELEKIKDPGKRNQAVLEWIESHKDEFGGGFFDNDTKGWASLEPQLFGWVMESCIPVDCWRALKLSQQLNTRPEGFHPSFSSKTGRQLLLDKVFDGGLPEAMRLLALQEFGGSTFWYSHTSEYPSVQVVTRDEQAAVIDKVLPLLQSGQESWRVAAVRCLRAASWPNDANYSKMNTQRALPQLVEQYRRERSAQVLEELADTIRRVGDEAFWQNLTGNPRGIVVLLGSDEVTKDRLRFNLNLEHTKAKIIEAPRFMFRLLDAEGNSVRTREFDGVVGYPEDCFIKGWEDTQGSITMTVANPELESGIWRVTVQGRIDGQIWRSEFVEIAYPGLMQATPNGGGF